MVIASPLPGACGTPSIHGILWLINGGDPITTYHWDDPAISRDYEGYGSTGITAKKIQGVILTRWWQLKYFEFHPETWGR